MDLTLRTYLRLTSLIIGGALTAGILATSTTACDRRRTIGVVDTGPATTRYEPPPAPAEKRARAAEEVNDPRAQRDAILDSLYAMYGGGRVAHDAKKDRAHTAAPPPGGDIG